MKIEKTKNRNQTELNEIDVDYKQIGIFDNEINCFVWLINDIELHLDIITNRLHFYRDEIEIKCTLDKALSNWPHTDRKLLVQDIDGYFMNIFDYRNQLLEAA